MKIAKNNAQEENVMQILKKIAKRVEENTVDVHSMKTDLKLVKLQLGGVEHNTEIMKVDIEKMKEDVGELKVEIKEIKIDVKKIWREVTDLTGQNEQILLKMVTQKEFGALSGRVSALEN